MNIDDLYDLYQKSKVEWGWFPTSETTPRIECVLCAGDCPFNKGQNPVLPCIE